MISKEIKRLLSGSLFLLFMTLQTVLGKKLEQSQKFLEDGTRIPVTRVWVKGNVVVAVKTNDRDHYSAIQLGFGEKKKTNKAMTGHIKGAQLEKAPKFLKEVRMDADTDLTAGTVLNPSEMFNEGDMIDITGISKGKGYAGVVKRHGFRGGPRTHGQSDRERAPGSIGQTTTPGRVFKGKKMAGRMGHEKVTIQNLQVVGVTENEIWVKGLVPGSVNSMVIVKKVGESKNFTPLFGIKTEVSQAVDAQVTEEIIEEKPEEDPVQSKVSEEAQAEEPQVKEKADIPAEEVTVSEAEKSSTSVKEPENDVSITEEKSDEAKKEVKEEVDAG